MQSWPARSTPRWSEISTSRRPLPRRSPTASSTGWRDGRKICSRTRCPRRWRRAGAWVRPRRSSARTRGSSQQSPPWHEQPESTPRIFGTARSTPALPTGPARLSMTTKREKSMTEHKIGTREEWLAAREQLLVREKEHTRLGDELARQRRELLWVPVEKDYRFDTDDGEKALL